MCVARHVEITQNNKFAISLQYLKKEVSDEVDFLQADKYESFLQFDSLIFLGMVKDSQSSQKSKFAMSLQYFEKEVRDKVEFLHADKHQSFQQVNWNTFQIKVFYKVILSLMGMIKNYQITQSNKFAPSVQYVIKEMEFIFCMQINIKVFTS